MSRIDKVLSDGGGGSSALFVLSFVQGLYFIVRVDWEARGERL